MEQWKSLNFLGYPNYEVSDKGRVRSITYKDKRGRIWYGRILKLSNHKGYLMAQLRANGITKGMLVHRLVAKAFLPNPNNLPQVNHINECKSDNAVSNLEWCDHVTNCNHGTRNKRISEATKGEKAYHYGKTGIDSPSSKYVYCIELDKVFFGCREAERCLRKLGYKANGKHIASCCRGDRKTNAGLHFRFATEEEIEEELIK